MGDDRRVSLVKTTISTWFGQEKVVARTIGVSGGQPSLISVLKVFLYVFLYYILYAVAFVTTVSFCKSTDMVIRTTRSVPEFAVFSCR